MRIGLARMTRWADPLGDALGGIEKSRNQARPLARLTIEGQAVGAWPRPAALRRSPPVATAARSRFRPMHQIVGWHFAILDTLRRRQYVARGLQGRLTSIRFHFTAFSSRSSAARLF
jgi:hypothetical protein